MPDAGLPWRVVLANAMLFQAGWLACALGAAHGRTWVGVAAAAAVCAWHLARAARPARELALVLGAALLGAAIESLFTRAGVVRFAGTAPGDAWAPFWAVAPWALFATTLDVSLRWLGPRPAAAALFGAIGGPAAYLAGERLGALELGTAGFGASWFGSAGATPAGRVWPQLPSLAAIGAAWAVVTPALLAAARRLDGYGRR